MQTNHIAFINRMIYDNDVDLFSDFTDELLANYLKISFRWHEEIVQLHAVRSVSEIHKRLFSRDLISTFFKRQNRNSNLKIRSELWIWLVIEHCMKQLFDSQAESRSMNQRNELLMIARSRSKMLVMMSTDSDKILLFVILSQLSRAKIIIVIVSLIALKQDLQKRCKQWSIHCMSYDSFFTRNQLHAVSSLLLVNIENVVTSDFVEFAQTLHVNDRLNRIVLNEIHQLLIINHYRQRMSFISQFRDIFVSFVCMIDTLSLIVEMNLKQMLHFTRCDTVRVSNDRSNLQYCVQTISTSNDRSSEDDNLLINETIRVCMQNIKIWKAVVSDDRISIARDIVYVRNKQVRKILTEIIDCEFYHETLSREKRTRMTIAWSQEKIDLFLVATSSFSVDVHYSFIRKVIHLNAFDDLVNYEQKIERVDRDDLSTICLTLLADRWFVQWNSKYRTDFLNYDCVRMTKFLQDQQCYRELLIVYLDEDFDIACNQFTKDFIERVSCEFCHHRSDKSSTKTVNSHLEISINFSRDILIDTSRRSIASSSFFSSSRFVQNALDIVFQISSRFLVFLFSSSIRHAVTALRSNTSQRSSTSLHATISLSVNTRFTTSFIVSASSQLIDFNVLELTSISVSVSFALFDQVSSDESENSDESFDNELDDEERETYDVVVRLACNAIVVKKKSFELFESRIVAWKQACIFCFFVKKRLIEEIHDDCLQLTHNQILRTHRRNITLRRFTACFNCDQMQSICRMQEAKSRCMQNRLIWHVNWIACYLDEEFDRIMISLLKDSNLITNEITSLKQWDYVHWLAQNFELFNRFAFNLNRLIHHWLNRLKTLCMFDHWKIIARCLHHIANNENIQLIIWVDCCRVRNWMNWNRIEFDATIACYDCMQLLFTSSSFEQIEREFLYKVNVMSKWTSHVT